MRRTETAAGTRAMIRRAAAWHAPRPSDEGLRELAELLRDTATDKVLPRAIRELAAGARFVTAETATNNMIGGLTKTAVGAKRSPRLGLKALAFQRCWSDRASWEWLACR